MVDLLDCPDDAPPEIRRALNQLIADQTLGSAVFRFQTESTNTDALAEVNAGLDPQTLPRLHWADQANRRPRSTGPTLGLAIGSPSRFRSCSVETVYSTHHFRCSSESLWRERSNFTVPRLESD